MTDDRNPAAPAQDPYATSAGAYVLGALTPSDRDAFEHHLRSCPDCRHAVEDLAGLPGLLSRVPREVVDALEQDDRPALAAFGDATAPETAVHPGGTDGPPLPDTVLAGLLREVRRRRVRRRAALTGGLVAAAGLVAAFAGGVLGDDRLDTQAGPSPTSPSPTSSAPSSPSTTPTPTETLPPAQPMQPLLEVPVTATARLTQVAWGTKVDITCAYAQQEAAQPYDYTLVVRDKDGVDEQIGSWKAMPGRDASLSGATALPLDRIAAVEIRTMTGTAILQLVES